MRCCFRFVCTVVTLLAATAATAAEPGPGDACTTAGAFMRSGGPEVSGGGHFLVCNGSTWVSVLDYKDGGTTLTQVGNDTGSCTAAKDGRIRYVASSDPPWEYCDGGATTWRPFKQPRCQDDDTGECYLDATRSNDDPDFTPANIAAGKNILGVEGESGGLTQIGVVTSSNLRTSWEVAVSGNYAFVTSNHGNSLTSFDISDPSAPTELDSLTSSADLSFARGLAVAGQYAYVASWGSDSLTIIDISNPSSLSKVGGISTADLDGASDVEVRGDYAYVASYEADSLTIIDVSDPAAPTQVGAISNGHLDEPNGVAVAGTYAYVASRLSGELTVIDVSDPAAPAEVTSLHLSGGIGISVSGNYAYVPRSTNNYFSIVDISNPTSPTEVSTTALGVTDPEVAGSYVYAVRASDDALVVIDVSNPTTPVVVDALTSLDLTKINALALDRRYAVTTNSTLSNGKLIVADLGNFKVSEYGECVPDSTDRCLLDQNRAKYDTDFKPGKIASGVNILGVTGTLSGGGGGAGCAAPTSCPSVGDVCSDGSLFAGFLAADDGSCRAIFVTDDNQSTSSQWKTAGGTNDITNPDDHVDGQYNRDNRGGGTFPAFELCENNTYHGKNDWYLPARAELNLLWLNQAAIDANAAGAFTTSAYWSSTEDNTNYAWFQVFGFGYQDYTTKPSYYGVRCVRSEDASAAASSGGCTPDPSCPNVGDVCSGDGSGGGNPKFAGCVCYYDANSADAGTCKPLYVTQANQSTSSGWKTSTGANDIVTDSTEDGKINDGQVADSTTFPAFKLCKDLSDGGYTDWYLPARTELDLLWRNNATITSFTANTYWSSTESSSAYAWGENFGIGFHVFDVSKPDSLYVRCVRRD
ncbi:MAG: DUF1566 domain-containing protein [Rhodospirillaceae bacterium]|nr:DUF1566 domain-containing protein [Rhodospirillaceae bacterium]